MTRETLRVPLFRTSLGREELDAVEQVFQRSWVGAGPETAAFEREMGRYLGREHAVATNSASAGLHLALRVLNLPRDAEVLVPTVTFVSTAHAVEHVNARVVFVDVRPTDLCIDVDDMERRITSRTRAIMPVHMGGQPCEMNRICDIARSRGLVVVEDVANAQGGSWKGRRLGAWGDFGVFSFEAKKNMTTGDGGMICFDDERFDSALRRLRWVGINRDTWTRFDDRGHDRSRDAWYYEVEELGFKYGMNDIAAAIGRVQLRKLDAVNEAKRRLIARYLDELEGVGDLYLPPHDLEAGAYWLFIVHTERRDDLFHHLANRGIGCGVHFMPAHLHPYYRKRYPEVSLPSAELVWSRFITLPLYGSMTEAEQSCVVDAVRSFFDGRSVS